MDKGMEQEEKEDKTIEEDMEEEKIGGGQSERDEKNLLATAPGEDEGDNQEETVIDKFLEYTEEVEEGEQEEVKEIGR